MPTVGCLPGNNRRCPDLIFSCTTHHNCELYSSPPHLTHLPMCFFAVEYCSTSPPRSWSQNQLRRTKRELEQISKFKLPNVLIVKIEASTVSAAHPGRECRCIQRLRTRIDFFFMEMCDSCDTWTLVDTRYPKSHLRKRSKDCGTNTCTVVNVA